MVLISAVHCPPRLHSPIQKNKIVLFRHGQRAVGVSLSEDQSRISVTMVNKQRGSSSQQRFWIRERRKRRRRTLFLLEMVGLEAEPPQKLLPEQTAGKGDEDEEEE